MSECISIDRSSFIVETECQFGTANANTYGTAKRGLVRQNSITVGALAIYTE